MEGNMNKKTKAEEEKNKREMKYVKIYTVGFATILFIIALVLLVFYKAFPIYASTGKLLYYTMDPMLSAGIIAGMGLLILLMGYFITRPDKIRGEKKRYS
jgi:hypothetical protein